MKLPPLSPTIALAATLLLAAPALGQPSLTRAVPRGISAGQTTEVTLHGAKLAGATGVWTSFPAQVEIIAKDAKKPSDTQLRVRLTPEKNLPVQIGALVVATRDGASAPLLVMIDDLPSIAENSKNTSASAAQPIETLTAVDGVSQAGSSDFFAFEAAADQRIAVEVLAQRLGSKFDPVVWLRDEAGRVLRLADDDASLAADCRFSHTFDAAGRYSIEVRDNSYRAGLPYRLRVGDFPIVSTTLPLGVQAGSKARLLPVGADAAGADAIEIATSAGDANTRQPIGAKRKRGASSALAAVVVSELDEILETAQPDEVDKSLQLTVPCAINGQIALAGETDVYPLSMKKGDKLQLSTIGQSLGSPTLIAVQMRNDKGAVLAETPFDSLGEPALSWTAPADGEYSLAVRDLLDRGGPEFTYRVVVENAGADFSLTLKSDGRSHISLPDKNAYLVFDVVCNRQGYDGPIELQIEGDKKFALQGNLLGEKSKGGKLIVELAEPLEPGALLPIKIIGTAKVGDREIRRTVSTIDLLRTETPELLHPPAQISGWVVAGVRGAAKPLFELPAPKEGLAWKQGVGELKFTLTPKRNDANLKSNLSVKLSGLPKDFGYKLKVNGKAPKETYEITLTGPKDAAVGEHEFALEAQGDAGGVGSFVRQQVILKISEPAKDKPQDESKAKSEQKTEPKPASKKE